MAFKSEEQRKAVMAKLRGKLSEKKWIKRAALGAALAAVGGGLLWKAPRARTLGRVLIGAGAASAVGAGGKAYQAAREHTQAATGVVKAGAKGYGGLVLEQLRRVPVERGVATLVDLPFAGLEARLHGKLAKHVDNLSTLAASKLGGASAYATTRLGEKARIWQGKLLRMSPEDLVARRVKAEELLRPHLQYLTKKRTLRTDVVDLKFRKAAMHAFQDMMHTGQIDWHPSELDVERWLRQQNLPVNEKTRAHMHRVVAMGRFFGTNVYTAGL